MGQSFFRIVFVSEIYGVEGNGGNLFLFAINFLLIHNIAPVFPKKVGR